MSPAPVTLLLTLSSSTADTARRRTTHRCITRTIHRIAGKTRRTHSTSTTSTAGLGLGLGSFWNRRKKHSIMSRWRMLFTNATETNTTNTSTNYCTTNGAEFETKNRSNHHWSHWSHWRSNIGLSSLIPSLWWYYLSSFSSSPNKIPRGFEHFFPPQAKRFPPPPMPPPSDDNNNNEEESKSESESTQDNTAESNTSTSSSTDPTEPPNVSTLHSSSQGPDDDDPKKKNKNEDEDETEDQQGQKKQDKNKKKDRFEQFDHHQIPSWDEHEAVLAFMVALSLGLMMQAYAFEKQNPRKEITWVTFRNKILPCTERLFVVNKKVAYVVLSKDKIAAQQLQQHQSYEHAHDHHDDQHDLGLDSTLSSATSSTMSTSSTSAMESQPSDLWTYNTSTIATHTATPSLVRNPSMDDLRIAARAALDHPSDNDQYYYFYIPTVEWLEEKLTQAQADAHIPPQQWLDVQYTQQTNWALSVLQFFPFVGMFLLMGMSMYRTGRPSAMTSRQQQQSKRSKKASRSSNRTSTTGGLSNLFSIQKSPAKKIQKEDVHVTFADVAGCAQAKLEVMEFVDFLKDADRFTKLGAKIPKGALLHGPPGTGKTLLARAVAGESGVPFFSISGSDFVEMFVGVGASRVRDLFKEARENAPCIIFIDEIDAVGRKRGGGGGFSGGGNDERESTLNQLLVEMDGFSAKSQSEVVVLAGTNRVDILDQALTRPGRFDRQIAMDRPDLIGRKEIFLVHLKGIVLEESMEDYAGRLAGLTPGFVGADIANICNEAAIVAARRKASAVSIDDFEKAIDRIIGGLESGKIMSAEEKSIVAHHEAGHAIAGWFLEHADPLLKVTIIPRSSGALGFAQLLPKELMLRSKDQIMDIVCMTLAGRAAEDVFFGRVTTGAYDDLQRVTKLVYGMIRVYGMNQRLGLVSYLKEDKFNETEWQYSDSTAEAMDEEARLVVDAAYERTVALIKEHKAEVEKLAALLLEKETITHDDITDLVGPRPFANDPAYEEFVSHRASTRKKQEKKAEQASNDEEEVVKEADDDAAAMNLTPAL